MESSTRKRLLTLLAEDRTSARETTADWRELAAELYQEVEGLMFYAGGYQSELVRQKGRRDPMAQRVDRELKHTQKTYITPYMKAELKATPKTDGFPGFPIGG